MGLLPTFPPICDVTYLGHEPMIGEKVLEKKKMILFLLINPINTHYRLEMKMRKGNTYVKNRKRNERNTKQKE